MRLIPALLCFSVVFPAAPAAEPAALPVPAAVSSPIDTYISARDSALAAVKADPGAEGRALAGLDRLIRQVVAPWRAAGVADKGQFTLSTLDEGDVGYGAVDGLQYSRGDTIVTVTTKPLLARWMADHRTWWDDQPNIPASMTAAFRSDAFYTQAFSVDSGAFLHGLVLVKAPAGADLAVVDLAAFAQDLIMDRGPDTLLAVVVRGDRIFIAQEPLKQKLAAVPFCQKPMNQTLTRAKALDEAKKSKEAEAARARADREYRDCFGVRLREQPGYAAVQKQAQALVDLLH